MRKFIVFMCLAASAAACTKANPDVCCTTTEQCTAIGVSDLRPCDTARVCSADGVCVAPQCTVDSDCTDSTAPICSDQLCVAKCTTDVQCTGWDAPHCDSDGACVACTANTECTGSDAPVCDATSHACRGCGLDSECDTGVCLEYLGECAGSAQLLYVSASGSDNGQCSETAPCQTIAAAVELVTGQRNVIRLIGAMVTSSTDTITPSPSAFTIDGDSTTIIGPGSDETPMFALFTGSIVEFEGVGAGVSGRVPTLLDLEGGEADGFALTGLNYQILVDAGQVSIRSSTVTGLSLLQTSGNVTLTQNLFTASKLSVAGPGQIVVQQNDFEGTSELGVSREGSVTPPTALTFVNNLVSARDLNASSLNVTGLAPHSLIAFNTFVNNFGSFSARQDALVCDANDDVIDNIIAWSTTKPPTCPTTYSLFDANTTQTGTGNQSADVSTFFVDLANGDFHLGSASPARGAGSAVSTVTTDLEGTSRATPPSIGAYEATAE